MFAKKTPHEEEGAPLTKRERLRRAILRAIEHPVALSPETRERILRAKRVTERDRRLILRRSTKDQ